MKRRLRAGLQGTYREAKSAAFNRIVDRRGPAVEPPIYVCGHARSGTSWVAATLSQTGGVVHYHEPSDGRYWGWSDSAEQTGYFRLEAGQESSYFTSAFDAPFNGCWSPSLRTPLRHAWSAERRVLVKDVWTAICPRWVIERYRPVTVAIYRSPHAVVASQLAREIDSVHGLKALRAQPATEELLPADVGSFTEVQRVALLWSVTTKLMVDDLALCDRVVEVRYSEIARAPETGFAVLAEQLRLPESAQRDQWIRATTQHHEEGTYAVSRRSVEHIDSWLTSLTAGDIAEIDAVVSDFDLPGEAVAG